MRCGGFRRAVVAAWLVSAVLCAAPSGCGRKTPETAPPPPSGGSPQAAAPVRTSQRYRLVATIETGLSKPRGIALDGEGRLYVAGEEGVRVLTSRGKPLRRWSTPEAATCIALDPKGNVIVGLRTRVLVFDPTGKPLQAWGEAGTTSGRLRHVTAVAAVAGEILVADAGNRCIHRFDATGDFIGDIGRRDMSRGFVGLICPSPYLDIVLDEKGVLHVTNPGLGRVERYRRDGALLGHWGEPGTRPEQFFGCCNPTHIALLPDGSVATSEKLRRAVKVYDAEGRLLAYIGKEHFSKTPGLDLAVDSKSRILVLDPGDGKVKIFERVP